MAIVSLEYNAPKDESYSSSKKGSLRLAQEMVAPRLMRISEVAAIIDEMHGIEEPCSGTKGPDAYDPDVSSSTNFFAEQVAYLQEENGTQEKVEEIAKKFGAECSVSMGLPIKIQVYAFWSNKDIADNYKLICPVGIVENKRLYRKTMRIKINVTSVDNVDFGYYVVRDEGAIYDAFSELFWVSGKVVDSYGRLRSIESPRWDGGTKLYFSERVSGSIFIEFDTEYDAWDLILPGVWTTGKRDYSASVWGIWDGDVPRLDVEVPDADQEENETCRSYDNISPVPDLSVPGHITNVIDGLSAPGAGGLDYTSRDDEEEDDEDGAEEPEPCDCGSPCTAEGFEDICCQPPKQGCVPTCLEFKYPNPGGHVSEDSAGEDDTEIVFVGPPEGEDCGQHVIILEVKDKNCDECEGIPDLEWDSENPTVVANGGSVWVVVQGGSYPDKPITWKLEGGSGYSFEGGGSEYENGPEVEVFAASDACGQVTVKANNGCSETEGELRNTEAVYFTVTPRYLFPGQTATVNVAKGNPPYTWDKSGNVTITSGGGSTQAFASIRLNADACDDGWVSCQDVCDTAILPIINTKIDIVFTAASKELWPNGTATVQTANGKSPFTWTSSSNVAIEGGGTSTHTWASIRLSATACDDGWVKCEDICGEAEISIINTKIDIVFTEASKELWPNGAAVVQTANGKSPFTWTSSSNVAIEGGGTSTHTWASIRLSATACDDGWVKCEDICGEAEISIINLVPPLSLYGISELCQGASGIVNRSGGVNPVAWSVTGDLQITSGGSSTSIYAVIKNNGGGGTVYISDMCSAAERKINEIPPEECD